MYICYQYFQRTSKQWRTFFPDRALPLQISGLSELDVLQGKVCGVTEVALALLARCGLLPADMARRLGHTVALLERVWLLTVQQLEQVRLLVMTLAHIQLDLRCHTCSLTALRG
jgi:hypothetical protein